jgi:hypothetical protein
MGDIPSEARNDNPATMPKEKKRATTMNLPAASTFHADRIPLITNTIYTPRSSCQPQHLVYKTDGKPCTTCVAIVENSRLRIFSFVFRLSKPANDKPIDSADSIP